MKKLRGTGIALVTPFDREKKVDFESLSRLSKYAITKGVNYLVILGTTGEPATLRDEEKNEIICCVQKANQERLPLVLNIGGNNTQEVVEKIQTTNLSGFEAILSVTPYYNRPSQEGIYQHFKTIAENTEAKIIIYNVPSRTGSNILPKTVLALARAYKNIAGIKEASGNLLQAYEILREKPSHFSLISGDDALALPITLGGGDGVISVLAQALPDEFSSMIRYALKGKPLEAFKHYYKFFELMHLIYQEGNPAGVKSLLHSIGICKTHVRLPLVEASATLEEKIKRAYEGYTNITTSGKKNNILC
ncbi:4-hydroxy-tetrahydrodipicolinate synthase [Bacteroidetes bacterium endosymbiont of Geopemphigus sp.]|uniref:4-hydroxy-tetrahydrodipicolinate synthase n=1 Tax=Bacteroidetes bacterium endosymbiont of Geopemphigus sp. TaxID=2047937 RepID=UPI000CD2F26B|nr:4-hydroxy-tetrahydrodipicolinate synthase [Bacteroidetes bacterium endosymbiont of Geopemphigus sp.]